MASGCILKVGRAEMQFQCWIATVALLLSIPYLARADETFISTPTSVNATLGSQTDFRCAIRGITLYWTVNGDTATNNEMMKRNIRVSYYDQATRSTLHILASTENNNSVIVCTAIVGETFTQFSATPAVLKVQGLLGPPTNLQLNATNDSVTVQWSHPFTLNISNTEPDIHNYSLYITNVNTGESQTISVNETEFTFEMKNPDPCHNYTFYASAWNLVGEGQRSEIIEGFFFGVPYSIHYGQLSIAVAFLPTGTPDVQLTIQISTCECLGRRPEFFTIMLQGTYDTRQQVFKREIPFSDQQDMSQITLTLPKTLAPNELYTVAVIPGNRAGNSAFNIGSIHFSTFDTQDAYVTVINSGDICASCYFAEGTNAQGCLVALGSPMNEELKNLTAFRSNDSAEFCDTILKCHELQSIEDTYTCKIYDMEHDAEIGAQPAYTMERIPVVSPENITYTDSVCGSIDEQHNNMTKTRDQTALYGCTAASGLAIMLAILMAILCCCKCKKAQGGSDSQSSSKDIPMKPNCAYETTTMAQQSAATDSQN